jgi:hypothetical protein
VPDFKRICDGVNNNLYRLLIHCKEEEKGNVDKFFGFIIVGNKTGRKAYAIR